MMWLYWLEGFIHKLQCRQQISLRPPSNSLRILGNILNITRQNILDILLVLLMLVIIHNLLLLHSLPIILMLPILLIPILFFLG
ncbi:hypothetical protein KSS87_014768 [Heliosperma pusillum]|nr:hypothetical protein KSS87_014768 [Heliosperma pusillum]